MSRTVARISSEPAGSLALKIYVCDIIFPETVPLEYERQSSNIDGYMIFQIFQIFSHPYPISMQAYNLLIGKYDCEENAARGKQISEEIFAEMDENFLLAPHHSEEGPVIYSVDY